MYVCLRVHVRVCVRVCVRITRDDDNYRRDERPESSVAQVACKLPVGKALILG